MNDDSNNINFLKIKLAEELVAIKHLTIKYEEDKEMIIRINSSYN